MVAYRLLAQAETVRYLRIALPLRDHTKYFSLALCQLRETLPWSRWGGVCKKAHQALRYCRAEYGLSMRNRPDCPKDFLLVCPLQQVASRPRSHRREDRVVVLEHS